MAWPAGGSAGIQNNVNTPRILATDDVKWTGEGVAAVVAETEAQAYDAIEAITVDWEPLPTVVDAEKATQPGAPQLHPGAPGNLVLDFVGGDEAATNAAFAKAAKVVKLTAYHSRVIGNPMEPRAAMGAYDAAREYAGSRKQFGRHIGSFQAIHFMLADMATEIEAGTHLLYTAARLKQAGKPFKKEAAMAKLYCSELAMRTTTKAVQIFGGYGYTAEYPVERMMRDAKVCEIGEGTSEIQRIVIARQILGAVVDG